MPKFPVSRPCNQRKYWSGKGTSRPSWCLAVSIASLLANSPSIAATTSPGITFKTINVSKEIAKIIIIANSALFKIYLPMPISFHQ